MDLRLDGWCDSDLDDAQAIRMLLVNLAERIGMTIVNGPTVVSFKEAMNDPEAGLSAFVVIAESHLAIHTWPKQGYIMFDVVSCRDFDAEVAESVVKETLGLRPHFRSVTDRQLPFEES